MLSRGPIVLKNGILCRDQILVEKSRTVFQEPHRCKVAGLRIPVELIPNRASNLKAHAPNFFGYLYDAW